MRTTIDLPPAKHRQLRAIAAKRAISLGQLVVELTDVALGINPANGVETSLERSPVTGFLTLKLGRPISSEEVAALLDAP